MSEALKEYMVRLASDLDALCDFVAEPRNAATAAGLEPADIDTLMSGDQARIFTVVGIVKRPEEQRQAQAGAEEDSSGTSLVAQSPFAQTPAALTYVTPTVVGGVYAAQPAAAPGYPQQSLGYPQPQAAPADFNAGVAAIVRALLAEQARLLGAGW